MNYFRCSTNDFGSVRNIVIGEIVRLTGCPLSRALELTRGDIVFDDNSIMVGDVLIPDVPEFVIEYLKRRPTVFPNSALLFPTLEGKPFHPAKYSKQFKGMLKIAGLENVATHPNSLSEEQWQKVLNILFQKKRAQYQAVLAGIFCSYLGLRPSEVAKLKKRDLDFAGLIISLRDTKSQEDQEVPMLPFMAEPLKQYVSHLKLDDPLFVRLSGEQWDRSDTCRAVVAYGKRKGFQGQITPRRLRASLGRTMSESAGSPSIIASLLRHKDPATSLQHYITHEISVVRDFLDNMDEPGNPQKNNDLDNQNHMDKNPGEN